MTAFHPVADTWFRTALGEPTAVQERTWAAIQEGHSVLVSAPTGSGKTLAAFFVMLDRWLFAPPHDDVGCKVLYVSPLKALAVDIRRNLEQPLAELTAAAREQGTEHRAVSVAVRSGDTPPSERQRMVRHPPDILITTPESLYLMLTSRAREVLATVDQVIVDEIHAMVPSKRGSHLALSLERLEELRHGRPPLQRIGLSATQRPLSVVARFLGGATEEGFRPVQVVEASRKAPGRITVEVALPDMGQLPEEAPASPLPGMFRAQTPRSIWPAITPRLVEWISSHHSTLVFVNSRALAEKLTVAINETAGRALVQAHHGSLSKELRSGIEFDLKRGRLKGVVATSSLEMGIDMGAVDLVIQVEAPMSIASGLQRIGRANHQVGAVSDGIVVPKYRGDLVACVAAAQAMADGDIEPLRYPELPLDVLAQQVVAHVAAGPIQAGELLRIFRRAAPYTQLSEPLFRSVLQLVSGRYPARDFTTLQARITWDEDKGLLEPESGTQRVAVINGGTIPDRGLYRVVLAPGIEGAGRQVGRLEEELVYETRVGDALRLGAGTWRVTDITPDTVQVIPAPGEEGRAPFWHGMGPGRPAAFGARIGSLLRGLDEDTLQQPASVSDDAWRNLRMWCEEQKARTALPTDHRIVTETFVDGAGDLRLVVLSPWGRRVHAPWAMAVRAWWSRTHSTQMDIVYGDDGLVFRLPKGSEDLDPSILWPPSGQLEALLREELRHSPLLAARFREAAGRALLLVKRRPDERSPLWALRRRSTALMNVALEHPDFPILLEAARECLQEDFDLHGLKKLFADVEAGRMQVEQHEAGRPSPFANAVMFEVVGSFMYEGDLPPTERRVRGLGLDASLLEELLGRGSLAELLDPEVVEQVAERLSSRPAPADVAAWRRMLQRFGPAVCPDGITPGELVFQDEVTGLWWADEDRQRLQLARAGDPLAEEALALRQARGALQVRPVDLQTTLGFTLEQAEVALERLRAAGVLWHGVLLPDGAAAHVHQEHIEELRRRSLQAARARVQPVDLSTYQRALLWWHQLGSAGDAEDLLDILAPLQGVLLRPDTWLQQVLPVRLRDFAPAQLDLLLAQQRLVWQGRGDRITFWLADSLVGPATWPDRPASDEIAALLEALGEAERRFDDLAHDLRWLPSKVEAVLREAMRSGFVTSDSLQPHRRVTASSARTRRRSSLRRSATPSGLGGRFRRVSPVEAPDRGRVVELLLERTLVWSQATRGEDALQATWTDLMGTVLHAEARGDLLRGYFVDGLGAGQSATGAGVEALRDEALPVPSEVWLSAADPASQVGLAMPWPEGWKLQRREQVRLCLQQGEVVLAWDPTSGALWSTLGEVEAVRALWLHARELGEASLQIQSLDGRPVTGHPRAPDILALGAVQRAGEIVIFPLRKAPAGI